MTKGATKMERKEMEVTVARSISFSAYKYAGYGMETRYIHKFTDADGRVYVWKTTAALGFYVESERGDGYEVKSGKWVRFEKANEGDVLRISATVAGESEYNGEQQTELKRVRILSRSFKAKTAEEIEAEKKAKRDAAKKAQLDSLTEGDLVWEMDYKRYKEHYSDCETVVDSFYKERGRSYVSVIIRDGRLKASGTRGMTYSGYQMTNEDGGFITYRAVSEDNALKRVRKDFPDHTWECTKIYNYRDCHRVW